jgi:hypothetical protein
MQPDEPKYFKKIELEKKIYSDVKKKSNDSILK